MRSRLRVLAVSALVLGCLAPGAVSAGPTAPRSAAAAAAGPKACGLDAVPRDAWYPVPLPGPGKWSMGNVDNDPCVLVAASFGGEVRRSTDGGRTWRPVLQHSTGFARVFSEQLDGVVVVAEAHGANVLVSTDGGRTFAVRSLAGALPAAEGITSEIVGATVGGETVYVARVPQLVDGAPVRHPSAATLFQGAASADTPLQPVTGSAALSPVALAWDQTGTALIIGDDRAYPLGGVWILDGTDLKQAVAAAGITDVTISPLNGTGRAIYASSTEGVHNSVDGGGGWGKTTDEPVYAIRAEWGSAGVVLALTGPGRRPEVSNDAAEEFVGRGTGLPPECRGTGLQRTSDVPSYFLLACNDGRTFRYLSSGSDFAGALPPAGGPSPGGPGSPGYDPRLDAEDMKPLRSWKLSGVGTASGSIAFDGEVIYYADIDADPDARSGCSFKMSKVVHRMSGRTGKQLPSVQTRVGAFGIDVDRDNRRLFVQSGLTVYDAPLAGGKATKMWDVPQGAPGCIQYSWDPTLKLFWGYSHYSGSEIYLVGRDGELLSTCSWGGDSGIEGFVLVGGTYFAGGAAIAAAGDGTAYLELEDDSTVLRLSRRCAIEAVFEHPRYSEVRAENDAVTCDTNSFPESALWIRDGDKRTVTAYEIPGAYCPLPTTISVSGPAKLNMLGQALVCSVLRLPWGPPVVGVDVALFADTMPLGVGRTDALGRVCATYVPAVDHPPLMRLPGRKPLQAVFLGTRAFRASTARGALTVLENPAPDPVAPRPAAPPVAEQPPAQPINQPAPHAQAAIRQAQSQAQAQAQGQAQPVAQANPNAVVVAQQQEQPQLAFVMEDSEAEAAYDYEMSAYRGRAAPVAPFGLAACGIAMAAAYAFAYRTSRARC